MSGDLAIWIVAAGSLVGLMSALFGVGGGVLMVPFMVLILGRGQHLAEGTSLLVIVPTALIGMLFHRAGNFIKFRSAALLAAGGVGGAYLGAALALRLPAETLQTMFGLFMALVGARTIYGGLTQMRSERSDASAGVSGSEQID